MKKFLCYDTNDAASGKINVSTNGILSPNATVPSTNGAANQYLVTDSNGNTKWEDRLAYADVVETDDITGMEVTVTSRLTYGDDIDMTLYVGNVWQVELSGLAPLSYTLTVEGLEDGTLVLGDNWSTNSWDLGFGVVQSANNNAKFKVESSLVSSRGIESVKFTCISGSITEEIVKTIDEKFIPSKETFFVVSGQGSFRTGTDWYEGEDATIADIVSAYHDGGAKIFQMSGINCIGISNVIGASAPGSSSPFITYYNYTSKTVFTKS